MKLGARIRKIRMFRNITQKELGRRLGYGESSADVRIAQYESGQRTPKQETLIRIAEIVGITMRDKKTMSYLQEWMGKKQKLGDGRITEEEYLEWKLHWPENKRKTEYKTV